MRSVGLFLYVYLFVPVSTAIRSHFSTDFHETWQTPFGPQKAEPNLLGVESEYIFPQFYFPSQTPFLAANNG